MILMVIDLDSMYLDSKQHMNHLTFVLLVLKFIINFLIILKNQEIFIYSKRSLRRIYLFRYQQKMYIISVFLKLNLSVLTRILHE